MGQTRISLKFLKFEKKIFFELIIIATALLEMNGRNIRSLAESEISV